MSLKEVVRCAIPIIKRERIVFTSCRDSSELVSRSLSKLGIPNEMKSDVLMPLEDEETPLGVWHCWVETKEAIVETNPMQMWGRQNAPLEILPKREYEWLLRVYGVDDPERKLLEETYRSPYTPQGEVYFNRLADEVVECVKRGSPR